MKQTILLFLLAVCLSATAFAQVKLSGLTTIYSGNPTDEKPAIAIAMSTANAAYQSAGESDEELNAKILKGRNQETITTGQVFDTSGAHFFAISESVLQAGQFEYQLTKNAETTVLPWTPLVSKMYTSSSGTVMNYIGQYKAERGNFLVLDLRKKGTEKIISSAIVFFNKTQPTLAAVFLGDEMKHFIKKLTTTEWGVDSSERKKWQTNYSAVELDTATGLPKKLDLDPDQNTIIFYLKQQVQKTDLLEYQLVKDGEVFIGWKKNDFDNGFIWLNNLPPGNYELKMRFTIQKENITTYPFRIRPRWDQTLTFKFIAGGLIAAFFGFLLLLYRLRRQRQKLRWTKLQKDKAETELRSIYSQLNPHFLFNALNSIQGLVNKNETENANYYLSTFSKLLRDSLVNSEKDRVPLSTELQTLKTYLQLEQLRFHFQYTIHIDESIDTNSVEIPSLLFQPLVENAIKHGVSAMQENGNIIIDFKRTGNDMIASITDNGKGFDRSAATNGFGLKLTRERIRLLNEADNESPVTLSIESGNSGTTIILHFKNWF